MKMGNLFGKCFGRKQTDRRIVLLLVGLDNAGKTRTANHLTGEGDRDVLPTVGFKAVNLVHRSNPVTIYDLGGGPQFREIWDQYYTDVHGVIFVVDSTDFQRVDECRDVLDHVLSHEKISGKPVLILANKQDLDGAMDDLELVEKLDIEAVVNRCRCPTRVEAYTANTPQVKHNNIDPGLHKGYLWLLNYVIRRYGDLNLRVQTDMNNDRQKRLNLQKQTSARHSNDEELLTAFENPNYKIDNSNLSEEIQEELDSKRDGIIIVKEANHIIDFDKIENLDSPRSAIKLSPLFGKRNKNDVQENSPIKLEARLNVRKLSPIVRRKFNVSASIESPMRAKEVRPQSSPGIRKHPESKFAKEVRSEERLDETRSVAKSTEDGLVAASGYSKFVEISLGDGVNQELMENKKMMLPPIVKSARGAKSATAKLGENSWSTPKVSHSSPTVARNNANSTADKATAVITIVDRKSHSASHVVRSQLEAPHNKRKLSLKGPRRNRTSPEGGRSIFAYDPPSTKSSARTGHSVGDFSSKTELSRPGLRSDAVI